MLLSGESGKGVQFGELLHVLGRLGDQGRVLHGIEIIQRGAAAGLQMDAQQLCGLLGVILLDQAVQDLQMLALCVVDLHLILFAGDDDARVVVEQLAHHFNDISVPAVLHKEQMHRRVQPERIGEIRLLVRKTLAEHQQFIHGEMRHRQLHGQRLDLDTGLENLVHVVQGNGP